MTTFVDPPEGWRYGFPKAVPDEGISDMLKWLIDEGYPAELIEALGSSFYVRYFESDKGEEIEL